MLRGLLQDEDEKRKPKAAASDVLNGGALGGVEAEEWILYYTDRAFSTKGVVLLGVDG